MSALTTWRRREPWWLRYRAGLWLHHTRQGVIPWPTPHVPDGLLAAWRDETLDQFCWSYTPKPGDTVVDVGAGIGSEVPTWVGLTGDAGRVIAIEAHPASYERLTALARANGYEVAMVQAAVADRSGTVTISDREDEIMNSILGEAVGPQVEARTLDDILAAHGVNQVDLLKMNIEGAEALAINGMAASIKNVKHAAIACHDFLADQERRPAMRTKAQIRSFLVENGFTVLERPGDSRPWVADCLYASAPEQ
jgi:FkbM family methyltransferase